MIFAQDRRRIIIIIITSIHIVLSVINRNEMNILINKKKNKNRKDN